MARDSSSSVTIVARTPKIQTILTEINGHPLSLSQFYSVCVSLSLSLSLSLCASLFLSLCD
jgi:hypothetical protein